jgi:hypothetical protein
VKYIQIPHLEPSKESGGIDTVVSPELDYDETLLGAEYSVIAIDPNRSYDEAEKEGHNG